MEEVWLRKHWDAKSVSPLGPGEAIMVLDKPRAIELDDDFWCQFQLH